MSRYFEEDYFIAELEFAYNPYSGRPADYEYLESIVSSIKENTPYNFRETRFHEFVNDVIENDDLRMFDIVVRHGYSVNTKFPKGFGYGRKQTPDPLSVAIKFGFVDIVDYILANNGIVEFAHLQCCIAFILFRLYDIFVCLLNTDFKRNDGDNLVSACMIYGNDFNIVPYIEIILAYGEDPNIPSNQYGLKSLGMSLVGKAHFYDVLLLLLKAGADPNNYDYQLPNTQTLISYLLGYPRRYMTLKDNFEKIIKLLLNYGADINIWNYDNKDNNNRQLLEKDYPQLVLVIDNHNYILF